jgi:hypothetical protein
MSQNLPRHVGRETNAETGYALVCTATTDGDPDTGPLCGKPATHHIRWEAATTENGLACRGHLDLVFGLHPYDVHSVENSACSMPGSLWVPGDPSYCTMLALDERPELTAAVVLPAGDIR